MAFNIKNTTVTDNLNRHLNHAKAQEADSLAKLASGSVFTKANPQPADRAITEKMEYRLRSLSASKRNINDAISLMQTIESSMSEINNIVTRMKEINIASASTTVSSQERRYLFIEYEALFDEINRISTTTEFNGIPLLNGSSERRPEQLIFRIDDPYISDSMFSEGEDINIIKLENLDTINTTTDYLGLNSARDFLLNSDEEEGIALEDVEEMLLTEDENFPTVYDRAITNLANQRAVFGALQSRLNRTLDYIDVYEENIAAAKSKIADTDYAEEVTKLLQARVQSAAATSLLAQTNSQSSQTIQLLNSLM